MRQRLCSDLIYAGAVVRNARTTGARTEQYCKSFEIIHRFAENLAQTLGVFHGTTETAKEGIEGKPSRTPGVSSSSSKIVTFNQQSPALCDRRGDVSCPSFRGATACV